VRIITQRKKKTEVPKYQGTTTTVIVENNNGKKTTEDRLVLIWVWRMIAKMGVIRRIIARNDWPWNFRWEGRPFGDKTVGGGREDGGCAVQQTKREEGGSFVRWLC